MKFNESEQLPIFCAFLFLRFITAVDILLLPLLFNSRNSSSVYTAPVRSGGVVDTTRAHVCELNKHAATV